MIHRKKIIHTSNNTGKLRLKFSHEYIKFSKLSDFYGLDIAAKAQTEINQNTTKTLNLNIYEYCNVESY